MIESNFLVDKVEECQQHIKFMQLKYIVINSSINKLPEIDNINLIARLNIDNRKLTVSQIKEIISRERYNYHLISITPYHKSISAFAAKERRIDIIHFQPTNAVKIFNQRYAKLLIEMNKIVEFDISTLFSQNMGNIRPLIRAITLMNRKKLPFILTRNPKKCWELRSYRGLQAVGRIIGLKNSQTDPRKLIDKINLNIDKINGKIAFAGVEI